MLKKQINPVKQNFSRECKISFPFCVNRFSFTVNDLSPACGTFASKTILNMLGRVLSVALVIVSQVVSAQERKVFHDDSTKPSHKFLPDITVVGRFSKSD